MSKNNNKVIVSFEYTYDKGKTDKELEKILNSERVGSGCELESMTRDIQFEVNSKDVKSIITKVKILNKNIKIYDITDDDNYKELN